MGDTCVQVEYRGQSAVITLNRPEKKNVFDANMWSGLEGAVQQLKSNLPRAIIITGAGNAFSAGFDVSPETVSYTHLRRRRCGRHVRCAR